VRESLLDYYRGDDGLRFLLGQAAGLVACAVGLCAVFGDGRLDLVVARWFFDDAQRVFPLTNEWLLKTVLHDAARTASALAAIGLLGLTLASWITPRLKMAHSYRRELLFASAASLVAAATVGTFKHFSDHACPWDLVTFGGTATYQTLLAATSAADAVRGCMPAAHPLTGYAWLGVGFALYPAARRAARRSWSVALTLGTLCGVVQIMRGAHFPSHVLWSAWFVWAANVALLVLGRYCSITDPQDRGYARRPGCSRYRCIP
jgi:membrane-associated PAP2 superfamily phosphatase